MLQEHVAAGDFGRLNRIANVALPSHTTSCVLYIYLAPYPNLSSVVLECFSPISLRNLLYDVCNTDTT